MKSILSEEQRIEAQQLVEAMRPRAEVFLQEMAEHLVANQKTPFGQPEFDFRDLLHRFGADALEASLSEKKTATKTPR